MKRGLITIIIIITLISVGGIIITQFMWVSRAVKMRTEQFADNVSTSLTRVVSGIEDYESTFVPDSSLIRVLERDSVVALGPAVSDYITVIDSLLTAELECLKIHEDYHYGVIDTSGYRMLFGDCNEEFVPQLLESRYQISLNSTRAYNGKPYMLSVHFPNEKQLIMRRMFIWLLLLSGMFMLVVIICFLWIIFTILQQKKLSEMKNDFINNMTHEFKTPISTISMAAEMMMKPSIIDSPERVHKYANIIFDENLRLRNQVEQTLQISVFDRSEFRLKKVRVDVHKVIENSIDVFSLIIKERNGSIEGRLDATEHHIMADEVHFINVISNLLDNAIKYSPEAPEVTVRTYNRDNGIVIIIQDKGVGISAENQKHIFKKFFRVHTGDIHSVRGYGLGLFYVKFVIEEHKGSINLVYSELQRGSTFEIYLPFNTNPENHEQSTRKDPAG
jgi:two-component system, OmpR family, phosphate regulon sensor histidine kinase PhoR